jgi:hypothetical protein
MRQTQDALPRVHEATRGVPGAEALGGVAALAGPWFCCPRSIQADPGRRIEDLRIRAISGRYDYLRNMPDAHRADPALRSLRADRHAAPGAGDGVVGARYSTGSLRLCGGLLVCSKTGGTKLSSVQISVTNRSHSANLRGSRHVTRLPRRAAQGSGRAASAVAPQLCLAATAALQRAVAIMADSELDGSQGYRATDFEEPGRGENAADREPRIDVIRCACASIACGTGSRLATKPL